MHCFSLVDLRCQWYPNTSRRHRTQDELRAHLLQLLAERAQGAVELARVMRLPAQWTIRLLHQLRAEGAVTRGPGGWRLAQ
jgi:predicted Rossmann fold nucleotide-binding protein DprA/Smf involved in DNA uptake